MACTVPTNFGFDVIVYFDNKCIRIEVKSNEKSQLGRYSWNVERHVGHITLRPGRDYCEPVRPYDDNAFDIIALVALDIRKVAYKKWPIPKRQIMKSVSEFDRYTFKIALDQHLHRNEQTSLVG